MWKGCAGPSGTRAGIFADQLAQQGMTGPFEPFEGSEGLWAKMLDREFLIYSLGHYNTCRHNQREVHSLLAGRTRWVYSLVGGTMYKRILVPLDGPQLLPGNLLA